MGSDLLKPYPPRLQTTLAVERPRPVPKGLRLQRIHLLRILHVERPRPVPKGLRLLILRLNPVRLSRKTPPCSKGIETLNPFDFANLTIVERPRPVPKGLRLPNNSSRAFSFSSKDPALFQRD